ncbi:GRASP55/65 PDZ-like domain-containing protein [Cunninghamella echinulata]|nr:GRASP55/65 PDZ-like domain-containing protein [Cunninghamella echinulata]
MGGVNSAEYGRYGFHILKVKENSPAFHAGIEQFFDYIVAINGINLENGDNITLQSTIKENENKPIVLTIYSSKAVAFRDVTLTPTSNWSSDPNEKSLLGCSLRYCTYERAGEYVWHILDVSSNSPAEMAGIIPHTDYIIGSPQAVLKGDDDFYNLVEDNLGKPLRLYVYNTEWDSCREVVIVPNHDWGGTGSLGCDVGFGLLHKIPRKKHSNIVNIDQQQQDQNKDIYSYSNTIFSSADFEPNTENESQSTAGYEEGPLSTPQQEASPTEAIPPSTFTSPSSPLASTTSNRSIMNEEHIDKQTNNEHAKPLNQEFLLHEAQNTILPESSNTEIKDN